MAKGDLDPTIHSYFPIKRRSIPTAISYCIVHANKLCFDLVDSRPD